MAKYRPLLCVFSVLLLLGCTEESSSTSKPPQNPEVDTQMDGGLSAQTDSAEGISEHGDAEPERKMGFELIEVQSPSSIRAWISPEISLDEFMALDLPMGWIKNQPRESPECGADSVRFIRSPDAMEDGEILIEEYFGFDWFHSATIIQMDVPIDDEGILRGVMVRKFHELIYNPGSCLILLIAPEGEVYFRVGRAADRLTDEPTLPEQWRLERYITPEEVVIELFGENTVIRTDNQDSFQGPVPQLRMRLDTSLSEDEP